MGDQEKVVQALFSAFSVLPDPLDVSEPPSALATTAWSHFHTARPFYQLWTVSSQTGSQHKPLL